MSVRVFARLALAIAFLGLLVAQPQAVNAQSVGIEMMNNMMPASAGMAGVSIANPLDVQSAIYGNPSTLGFKEGTQFGFSGSWTEPTYRLSVDNPGLPAFGVSPFSNAKSDAQGVALGNLGVTHDLSETGLPVTLGMGLMGGAGAGVDFRHIPESNGTYASIVVLDIVMSAGVLITEDLSVGGSLITSTATMSGPFVGITGAATDYALGGKVGFNYRVNDATSAGLYWRTGSRFRFDNLAQVGANFVDVRLGRPEIFGVGLSNQGLCEGKLLLAADATYQAYTETELMGALYKDTWSTQFGAQYALSDRCRVRVGYAWNSNPLRATVGDNAGGILPPGGIAHIQYVQALFAAIPQHRVTAGIGIDQVLPGIDFDLFGGGMFERTQSFGLATASLQGYWVGAGFTWRFGGAS